MQRKLILSVVHQTGRRFYYSFEYTTKVIAGQTAVTLKPKEFCFDLCIQNIYNRQPQDQTFLFELAHSLGGWSVFVPIGMDHRSFVQWTLHQVFREHSAAILII